MGLRDVGVVLNGGNEVGWTTKEKWLLGVAGRGLCRELGIGQTWGTLGPQILQLILVGPLHYGLEGPIEWIADQDHLPRVEGLGEVSHGVSHRPARVVSVSEYCFS